MVQQPNFFNQSPTNYNGYSSMRYYEGASGDKENVDVMRKVKQLKDKYHQSIHNTAHHHNIMSRASPNNNTVIL